MKTRKELREEYKAMKYRMGVFQLRNLASNKIFIGSSTDLKAAWPSLKLQLDMGIHANGDLQKDWTALGATNFAYEILEEIKESPEKKLNYEKEVKVLEEMMIQELEPYDKKGYNQRNLI
jgi:hypothetical protein